MDTADMDSDLDAEPLLRGMPVGDPRGATRKPKKHHSRHRDYPPSRCKELKNNFESCLTKKCVMFSVLAIVLIVILDGLIFSFIFLRSDDDAAAGMCYVSPACTTQAPANQFGFTNSTGWSLPEEYGADADTCCSACLPGGNSTVCFNQTSACNQKTGDGDYDFLLLDEIWVPQFCRALMNGYDPTLTHLEGMGCVSSKDELVIHGLWPNYVDGYPQCCNASGLLEPLDPEVVTSWEIYPALQLQWYDASVSGECSVCYALNHEWEKHGGCYSTGKPVEYFTTGLGLQYRTQTIDTTISTYSGQIVDTSTLKSLYSKKSNIVCDPNDPQSEQYLQQGVGILLETQTCWNRELQQIDCPEPFSGSFTIPCPEQVLLQVSPSL